MHYYCGTTLLKMTSFLEIGMALQLEMDVQ